MGSNRIPTFSLRLFLTFFITTLVSGRTSAQIVNSWNNPSSANWESASWSLGILPASNQSVFITNSGYKAVGIFPQTPVNFPNSMTVSNLTVSGPADGLDTLLLNYAGTAVPLHVRNDLAIGTNGTVLNYYTGLQVDHNLTVTGGQFAQEGGITTATNGSASVSFGTFNLTNASVAFGPLSLTGSTANQSGGATACSGLTLAGSTYSLLSGNISGGVNASSGTFVQSGGTNQGSVNVGWSTNNGFGYNGGFGNYVMQGGRLEASFIGVGVAGPLAGGDFSQSGGIVNAGAITLGGSGFNTYAPYGRYELTNGSLTCGSLAIRNGGFSQSGGSLLLNSALSLFGVFNDYGAGQSAGYGLGGGSFTNQGISMGLLGYFQQNGGTNQVAGTLEFRDTGYELSGGMLGTSNTVIWHAGFVTSDNVHAVSQFDHRGGAHKVSNVLSNFQDYNFYGGTLTAGGIYLRGAMNFYAGAPTATLSNSGILDLGGTLNFLTNATQNPGAVRLSANSRIYFFPGATLQFASSSGLAWSNGVHLTITNWHGSATGGGADQIRFGSSATGLTASQLAQVQFEDPPGLPPGNYQAQILPTGEIVPTGHLTVAGWGPDYYDTSRAPGGLSGVTAIASGFYTSAAILTNGSLISWGEPTAYDYYFASQQMLPDGLTNVAAIAIGNQLSLALLRDGTVIGSVGAYGATAPPPGLSNVVGIAAGRDQGVAVKDDGTVISWGYDGYGETNVPPGLSNVTAVAAGRLFGAGLKRDGTVVAWGNSYNGVTNIPPGLSNVVSISAEEDHGLALLANGTVVGWGDRTNLPPGISNVVSIAAGAGFDLALKSDGTVLSWYDYSTLTNVAPYLTNVVAIAVGNGPGLAILGTDYPQPFRLNAPHRLADGTAAFGLQGQLGQHYVIQQSSNLVDWTFNQNAAGGSGVVSITDPTAPPLGRRFYRALRVP